MVSDIAFYCVSVAVVVAAWRVVVTRDVARAGLALVAVLGGLAPIYLMLGSEFLAVVQVLVYVGAVVVLLLFATMLTRSDASTAEHGVRKLQKVVAGVVSAAVFAMLCLVFNGDTGNARIRPEHASSTADVGDGLLTDYLVPFEVVSVLLLVTLIGAIVLARRD